MQSFFVTRLLYVETIIIIIIIIIIGTDQHYDSHCWNFER